MNKRQRENLHKLAEFIENNPKEYNQMWFSRCIVGLGVRLHKVKKHLTKCYKFDILEFPAVDR